MNISKTKLQCLYYILPNWTIKWCKEFVQLDSAGTNVIHWYFFPPYLHCHLFVLIKIYPLQILTFSNPLLVLNNFSIAFPKNCLKAFVVMCKLLLSPKHFNQRMTKKQRQVIRWTPSIDTSNIQVQRSQLRHQSYHIILIRISKECNIIDVD